MQFASSIPWWLVPAVAAGIIGLAIVSYRRPLAPLSRRQRSALIALRALALALVAFFLSRPVLLLPPSNAGDVIVPVLVDSSRSMRVADADGESRAARAADLLKNDLLPGLAGSARVDVFRVTDTLTPATADTLEADGRKTNLAGAIAAVKDRYRGQRVAGIVLISDGGATGGTGEASLTPGAGIFAVGIGSPEGVPDREVLGITAGDPKLDQASIDLHVSAVAHGLGRDGFVVKLLANGQLVDSRSVVPAADGSPVDVMFTASPDPARATVFTAALQGSEPDAIPENDTRSILVSPAGRKRRILTLAGAPGYEHSFLLRALGQDPGLEVDSVVRKGKNDEGVDTYLVQAAAGRAEALTTGFPATREALFAYDALVIANIEGDYFTRSQLALAASFVSERGGGLLVLGGRSFERRGLLGTALEEVLPLELSDRNGGPLREPADEGLSGPAETMVLTAEGERHPAMRLAATAEETRKLWSTLPALASTAPLGGPRPGASVLAVTSGPNGLLPVVAVQRYGRGRSMIFAGEASWRWRMMLPDTDRRYDFFWRQSLRWLSADASDQVTIDVTPNAEPGDTISLDIEARDRAFARVTDAAVDATVTAPGGTVTTLPLRRTATGQFAASLTPEIAGSYRVRVEARQGSELLGEADRWIYVGGSDREMSEPRLNEGYLRRLTRESGGRYVRPADIDEVIADLRSAVPTSLEPVRRDLWHEPWAFASVILVLSAEWMLRRRWGLR